MQHQARVVQEVGRDGDGEGGALFGVSGGAKFVEEDEGRGVGEAGDAVEVDDVGGEAGEIALDGLGVADVGVDGVEERQGCGLCGTGMPAWAISASRPVVLRETVLPPVLGPEMMSWRASRWEDDGEGDRRGWELRRIRGRRCMRSSRSGVAGSGEGDLWDPSRSSGGRGSSLRVWLRGCVSFGVGSAQFETPLFREAAKDGAGAVEVVGEAGAGEVGFDFGKDGGAEVDGCGVLAECAGHGDEDAVDL